MQLQSKTPRRCALEFTVKGADPGQVRVRSGADWATARQETVALESLDSNFVADRLLRLLRAGG